MPDSNPGPLSQKFGALPKSYLELYWFTPGQMTQLDGLIGSVIFLILDVEDLDEVAERVAVLPRAAGGGGRLLSLRQIRGQSNRQNLTFF